MKNKITLTEQELWDFTYKEICNTLGISKVDLALSKNYKGFSRRFYYFIKHHKRSKN
jgi:hypothetical protein